MEHQIVVTFPAERHADARARVATLVTYAAKVGVPAPAYVISEPVAVAQTVTDDLGHTHTRTVVQRTLTIDVAPIVLPGGWQLLGTIHPTPEGNVVGCVPGRVIPALYRERDGRTCDYCHTLRQRTETHIVQNNTGTIQQVGSTCVRDFLGGRSPEQVTQALAWARALSGFAESFGEHVGGHYVEAPSLVTIVSASAYIVRCVGWVSGATARQDERKTSTANQVSWWLSARPDSQSHREWVHTFGEPNDTDDTQAAAAIAWALDTFAADDATPENDYLANLRVIVRLGYVQPKFHGYAVSLISAYLRSQDQLKEKARKADSQHVGAVGKRQVFDGLTVEGLRVYEGDYGPSTRIEFSDPQGNVLLWWASNAPSLVVGETVTVKATVKKHDRYNNIAQTVLSRAVILAT
jgi:hypothetical protein